MYYNGINTVIIDDIIVTYEVLEKMEKKHHISEEEIYEALLFGCPSIRFAERGKIKGEDLYIAYGRTEAGRYLKIHFIYKRNKKALIITARDASSRERRIFYGSR